MDAAPPNYNAITDRDHWHLVARHVAIDDLLSMVLVCRDWHEKLSPLLWGNPTSHFPRSSDRAKASIARFIQNLPNATSHLKELTHTLSFPHTTTDFNDWQREDWLPTVLDQLYRLQALVVRGAPIFDHASLLALEQHGTADWMTGQWHSSGLRLLDASGCRNATSAGLAIALEHLPMLVYVDLSATPAVRKYTVLEKFRLLQYLRVLKLRDVGLTDDNLYVLARAIGVKVRGLDVTGNRLTDASVDVLVEQCQLPADAFMAMQKDAGNETFASQGVLVRDAVQGDRFEDLLHSTLTEAFVDELSFDDGVDVGLTHLRIGENALTASSIPKLFEYPSFNVLDVGGRSSRIPTPPSNSRLDFSTFEALLSRLTYLRIHHSAVTSTSTSTLSPQPPLPSQMHSLPQIIARRQLLSARHQNTPHATTLLPNLPHLQSLVLTGIPSHSHDAGLAEGIIAFVRDCALQAALARRQVELDWAAVPPGGSLEEGAGRLFPLRGVVLEVVAARGEGVGGEEEAGGQQRRRQKGGLSTTGDADGEAFLAASAGDFSFFGDGLDGDTSSTSSYAPNRSPSNNHADEHGHSNPDDGDHGNTNTNTVKPMHDTIALISAFRKKAKQMYEESLSLSLPSHSRGRREGGGGGGGGGGDASTSGYWPGSVKVALC